MEPWLRFGTFVAVFTVLALAEAFWPRRERTEPRGRRWITNLGLIAVNVVVQRVTLGAAAFAAALWAQANGWGLFNLTSLPGWLEGAIGFLILDLAIYLQHVATHRWSLLWRLHQVHHADLDVDVTTGLRFHPVEILLSLLYKAALVVVFGIDPWAVVAFEAVLNASSIFTHANIHLPERFDRLLRLAICTPDMHRVHHSTERAETDSNYGFFLSVWDRWLGTMRLMPAKGHEAMELGLPSHRDPSRLGLPGLLAMPFRRRSGD